MEQEELKVPENFEEEDCVVEKNYVMKNPQLPSRLTKIKYEPWMINEIKKCQADPIYFAEQYFTIINLDQGRIKIPLYEVQKKALNMMVDNNRVVVCSSRQMGKCVYGAKVMVRNGLCTLNIPINLLYFILKVRNFFSNKLDKFQKFCKISVWKK